jgi:pimeloyl-ACP methyl ester carboxylesterase
LPIPALARRPPGVRSITPPRLESTVTVGRGRRLGYAEFGDPHGRLVLWFHGTPGGRRQLSSSARDEAELLGLRVVLVARPGAGVSTDHKYGQISDWARDVARVADHLGEERFAVVGLSGGGPYALACGALLPERVTAVGVIGGVVPSVGPDASATGVVTLAEKFNALVGPARWPMGTALWGAVRLIRPFAHQAMLLWSSISPPGDQLVFQDPEMEAMFIDDLFDTAKTQLHAVVNDAYLFGRDWGFRLDEVKVPVRWWHGDDDFIVPHVGAVEAVPRIPDCELIMRPGEGHLGGFAAADEVLRAIDHLWTA